MIAERWPGYDASDFEGVEPDVSNVVTEDNTPVDNQFSEKQMRLLTETLYTSWKPGVPFVAMANVGVFVALNRPPVVPDVLVTTGVNPPKDLMVKEHRSYFTWLYDGKPPEIVIEIVSNNKGGELDKKMLEYAHIRVPWYVVFDPEAHVNDSTLVAYGLREGKYQAMAEAVFPIGLKLVLWRGVFEGNEQEWLRWADADGCVLPTGEEAAIAANARAQAAEERALAEAERARTEAERAERLAAKLRAAGIDPDGVD